MEWLQHMRERIPGLESTEPAAENIFKIRGAAPVTETRDSVADREHGPAALQLVYQLADLVRSKESHAAEMETRAQALAKCAVDELKLAETRLRSAENARNAAEASVAKCNC